MMNPVFLLGLMVFLISCSASNTPVTMADLGMPRSMVDLEASLQQPGRLILEKHVVADWAIERFRILNLEHPKAQAAGLQDRMEPIQIYTYAITHPERGTFLVDSGMSESLREQLQSTDLSWLVNKVMNMDRMEVRTTTGQLARHYGGISGVLLTHIHLDHIMGLTDLGAEVPVYIGPGDAGNRSIQHGVTQSTTDRLLKHVKTLQEWNFETGVLDVFGDGSLWAIHSPGHTPGATAYLANTVDGVHLMLGDVTHTRWGWENGVGPGSFTTDIEENAESLAVLQDLAQRHPHIQVHPGHQSL